MLVDSRGGCGGKGGSLSLVGENMLLCKACSTVIMDIRILHREIVIMVCK